MKKQKTKKLSVQKTQNLKNKNEKKLSVQKIQNMKQINKKEETFSKKNVSKRTEKNIPKKNIELNKQRYLQHCFKAMLSRYRIEI